MIRRAIIRMQFSRLEDGSLEERNSMGEVPVAETAPFTWALLSKVFPLPNSDRRKLLDLFEGEIDKASSKDDETFYRALLKRLLDNDNEDFLFKLEFRFLLDPREKVKRRSFVYQVSNFLREDVHSDLTIAELCEAEEELFEDGSAEHELHKLLRIVYKRAQSESEHTEPETRDEEGDESAESEGWREPLSELHALIENFEMPSINSAQEIVDAANDLMEACAGHEETVENRTVDEKRAHIRSALAAVSSNGNVERLLAHIEICSSEVLGNLQPLAKELTAIEEEHAAVREKISSGEFELANLVKAKDYVALREVSAALERMQQEEGKLGQKTGEALRQMEAACGLTEPTDVSEVKNLDGEEKTLCVDNDGPLDEETSVNVPEDVNDSAIVEQEGEETPSSADEDVSATVEPEDEERPSRADEGASAPSIESNREERSAEGGQSAEGRSRGEQHPIPGDREPAAAPDERGALPAGEALAVSSDEVDAQIAHYLEDGEYALAWHLASLAEDKGITLGVPPVVFKALVSSFCVTGPFDAASEFVGEALAEAVDAVQNNKEGLNSTKIFVAQSLTVAALLRPALMAPETNARTHLESFSMKLGLAALAPLTKSLSELGHDFQPRIEDLRALAGTERELRTPHASSALRDWLTKARGGHSVHQPTNTILHRLTSSDGEFGRVAEAALGEKPEAEAAVLELIDTYSNKRNELERMIAAHEKNEGRHKKDRIRGMALDWICRRLDEGCDFLREWLEAHRADKNLLDDRRKSALKRKVGALQKLLGALSEAPLMRSGGRLCAAATGVLWKCVQALRQSLEGADRTSAPQRVSDALRMPLLRLPAICQPYAPDSPIAEFEEERGRQREHLFAALVEPVGKISLDEKRALSDRLKECAILPATELLERLIRAGYIEESRSEEFRQRLQEAADRARKELLEKLETLRLELATLHNLDLRTGEKLRKSLDQLELISPILSSAIYEAQRVPEREPQIPARPLERHPEIPADFPQTRDLLEEIQSLRDEVRSEIVGDQRARLQKVWQTNPGLKGDVETLMATLEARDPTTVEDIIASLQAGQRVVDLDSKSEEKFSQFFPKVVAQLEKPGEETNRGRIIQALKEGSKCGPLDFSCLEENTRRALSGLLRTWFHVSTAFGKGEDVRDNVRSILETIGFTSVRVGSDATIIKGKFRSMAVRSAVPVADGYFIPPDFGSISEGAYHVFLSSPLVPVDQVLNELNKVGPDKPSLLFVFGRMTQERRRDFAERARASKQRVLLIDESLLLFLISQGSSFLETLFRCASPFGYIQPYTTDPGSIPREMFFGRREEMSLLQSRSSDGCLVYGGRQLGKSALLNHVRKRTHDPDAGILVFYRSCDTLGGPSQEAADVWQIIASELDRHSVLRGQARDPAAISSGIREWLNADPNRRIVMLLDETDQFMSAEARFGFPNLTRMKELMIDCSWRFKVVFAGLHNVRRALKAPNTPLAHLGKPICIGPLNTTPENRAEARRLVVEPMKAAGFEYAPAELGWDILARVNHYPSLVQVFCKELVNELYRKPQPRKEGPRWKITRAQIFEGAGYRQIYDAIRTKFRLTLDLDPRYDLIAHVLALYRFDHGDEAVLRSGLIAYEIYDEVCRLWPPQLQRLDREDFGALLDEMVDLGVLSTLGPRRDRYGLRTAQVAQMLGQRDEIESRLLEIMSIEPRVDYDAALFLRRVKTDSALRRAPLSDRQLEGLFNAAHAGPRIVAFAPALWGDSVADDLVALARGWSTETTRYRASIVKTSRANFRRAVSGRPGRDEINVLIVAPEADWTYEWIEWAAKNEEVRAGAIVPIFVAGTSWLRSHHLENRGEVNAQVFLPRPWGNQMLRAFLAETDNAPLDHKWRRDKLIGGTGGTPIALISACEEMSSIVRGGGRDPDEALEEWFENQDVGAEEVGLTPELARIFGGFEDVDSEEDLIALKQLLESDLKSKEVNFDFKRLLLLFADLGLIYSAEAEREGICLTSLGHLVKRSYSKK